MKSGTSPVTAAAACVKFSRRPAREVTIVLAFSFCTGRAPREWTKVPLPSCFFMYNVVAEKWVPLWVGQSPATPNALTLLSIQFIAPMASLRGAIARMMRVLVETEGTLVRMATRRNMRTTFMARPATLAGTPI
eukprot:jgi/Botrbrau1/18813/Bobra.0775s0004.1